MDKAVLGKSAFHMLLQRELRGTSKIFQKKFQSRSRVIPQLAADDFLLRRSSLYREARIYAQNLGVRFKKDLRTADYRYIHWKPLSSAVEYAPAAPLFGKLLDEVDKKQALSQQLIDKISYNSISVFHETNHQIFFRVFPPERSAFNSPKKRHSYFAFIEVLVRIMDYRLSADIPEVADALCLLGIINPGTRKCPGPLSLRQFQSLFTYLYLYETGSKEKSIAKVLKSLRFKPPRKDHIYYNDKRSRRTGSEWWRLYGQFLSLPEIESRLNIKPLPVRYMNPRYMRNNQDFLKDVYGTLQKHFKSF